MTRSFLSDEGTLLVVGSASTSFVYERAGSGGLTRVRETKTWLRTSVAVDHTASTRAWVDETSPLHVASRKP
ncbi:MAG: hypothetical protein U0169_26580 [Polyangiaceae bacterium]